MLETLAILYLLSGLLYTSIYLLQIRDQVEILEKSKSRDFKIISKQKIERSKREIILCAVWPYLMYVGVRALIKYQSNNR